MIYIAIAFRLSTLPNTNGGVIIEKGSLTHSTEFAHIMNVYVGHEVFLSSFMYRTLR